MKIQHVNSTQRRRGWPHIIIISLQKLCDRYVHDDTTLAVLGGMDQTIPLKEYFWRGITGLPLTMCRSTFGCMDFISCIIMQMSLVGTRAVVFGGSRGIGKAIANILATHGASVARMFFCQSRVMGIKALITVHIKIKIFFHLQWDRGIVTSPRLRHCIYQWSLRIR